MHAAYLEEVDLFAAKLQHISCAVALTESEALSHKYLDLSFAVCGCLWMKSPGDILVSLTK